MAFSFSHSIVPMSELRSDPKKIKKQLSSSPIIITNKGKPDFGICDLETLEIATQIKNVRDLLVKRKKEVSKSVDAEEVFKNLNTKYGV